MSKKRLTLNTITPILLEIVTLACGFIFPQLRIRYYGSDVNGLISSITQFIGIITFVEAGVGSVIRYNFYKPLHEKDNLQISRIITSANRFFRNIALILAGYTLFLMIFYPMFAGEQFGHMYTALLILTMVISSFSQYYFSQASILLLMADQKGYVQYSLQIVTVILNTVVVYFMITGGCGIHAVKLASSLIFLIRPLYITRYVKRHYHIDTKIRYDGEPIQQKWNGLAQHVASVVLDSTDVIVLTVFSSLASVSVYSVYHMIVSGIRRMTASGTSGIEALIGNITAAGDREKLRRVFGYTEWTIHTISTFLYGCTAALIVPFIRVYTDGVTDADYIAPTFAMLITIANMLVTLRLPYSLIILSGGYYKQTQKCYITAAAINVVLSVMLVVKYGLVGVALGTIAAMLYQTLWMAYYTYRKILLSSPMPFIRQLCTDAGSMILIMLLAVHLFTKKCDGYFSWFLLALKTGILVFLLILLLNLVFYRKNLTEISAILKEKRTEPLQEQ